MAYSTGEGLILTRIRNLSNYDTNNTSRADWKILNRGDKLKKTGSSNHAVVLRPGPFEQEWISPTVFRAMWTTVIEVWQRYKDDSTTATDLYARAFEIIEEFHQYPKLGSGDDQYFSVTVTGGEPPQEMWTRRDGGPKWLKWEMSLSWSEQLEVTNQE